MRSNHLLLKADIRPQGPWTRKFQIPDSEFFRLKVDQTLFAKIKSKQQFFQVQKI